MLIGLLISLVVSSAVVVGNVRGAHPVRLWVWDCRPSLRIAEGTQPSVGVAAANGWTFLEELGAEVGPIHVGGPAEPHGCEVVVSDIQTGRRPDHAGWSSTDVLNGHAQSAVVELPAGASRLDALHELLHTQGFDHVQVSGHVLSRSSKRIGESTDGIVLP